MAAIGIVAAMSGCTIVAMALMVWLVRSGQNGLALTFIALTWAVFTILVYAAGRPFGIDAVMAMTWAMSVGLPALLGGLAGGVLGRLLRRRDDRARNPQK